jgi:hypothetical protein
VLFVFFVANFLEAAGQGWLPEEGTTKSTKGPVDLVRRSEERRSGTL